MMSQNLMPLEMEMAANAGQSRTHGHFKRPQTSQHQEKKNQNFRLLSGRDQNRQVTSKARPLSTNVALNKHSNTYKTDLKNDMIDFFTDAKEDM
jgi:hypothetical protein